MPAVDVHHLRRTFGSTVAVADATWQAEAGRITTVLGPNGAGKSTTTEMILGLTRPDAGRVEVFGADPITAMRRGDVGAMLQNGTLLWDVTVRRLLRLMHGLHAHPLAMDEVIERASLGEILTNNTNKLSGGQAQRVRFALAIMADPKLLILDEPTVGMDVDARRAFWASMDELATDGRTVVFATHYLDEADDFADRIVVLNNGTVVADGTGSQIKAVVAGRQVSFTGGSATDYSHLVGVVASQRAGDRMVLTSTDSDATLRELLNDSSVADVEITAPSLEDAFVHLVS